MTTMADVVGAAEKDNASRVRGKTTKTAIHGLD